jgi:hypothetical protein
MGKAASPVEYLDQNERGDKDCRFPGRMGEIGGGFAGFWDMGPVLRKMNALLP